MAREFDTDVLIIGGGLNGLSMGLAAAAGGFDVTIVDAIDPKTAGAEEFDGRVFAIAFASCRMYEALGLWDELKQDAQPINDILVTDGRVREGASPFFLHFDHEEIGDEALGHLMESRHMRKVLTRAVLDHDRITLKAPAKRVSSAADPYGFTATLDDGSSIRARICLGADGRGSPLREEAGIKTIGWTYDQMGIVTTVHHEEDHHGIAQEFFLPSGPFAILPMTGRRASLVWTERTKAAKALLGLPPERFLEELRARFGDYLGEIETLGPVWSYPLNLILARRYIDDRLALIGDAAHGVHPIAGQGLNLGLRDVAVMAEVLTDAARLGQDIGAQDVLERYQQWRRFDNVSLSLGMDALNRLFSNDLPPVRLARDLGLGVVNRIGPARRFFMRHAGGAVGELPRLLKGEAL
ncbi:MAG: FAD-binding protein [Alphaproteobacteria bacterium]|nr:MAG: FAD-binding protein [Alphaproteobacteria bacterium]